MKDGSGIEPFLCHSCHVAKVALAIKIIFMTVTQFSTNMRFSFDNDFNTLTTSSKLMGSHSKIVGSNWSSEVSESVS